jgi:hypothetical protein
MTAPAELVRQARAFARTVRAGSRAHDANPVRVARRARLLRARHGFDYDEALRAGLFDPRLSDAECARRVSRHAMLALQRVVNPEALGALSGDKGLFYRYAAALGLPIPEPFGIVGVGLGWRRGGGALADAADLAELLGSGLPEELVVKPLEGFHGRGVRVLRREEIDPGSLMEELAADPAFDGWIIQERLREHPAIAALAPGDALQTLRIATFVERSGEVEVLSADLRLALVAGPTDNFSSGRSGNGLVAVRLADGALGPLRLPRADGCGFDLTPVTPGGGAQVEGVRLPLWPHALALVREGALAMLPARTIGWDIAITEGGPVVVEANMYYWPRSGSEQGDAFDRIAGG